MPLAWDSSPHLCPQFKFILLKISHISCAFFSSTFLKIVIFLACLFYILYFIFKSWYFIFCLSHSQGLPSTVVYIHHEILLENRFFFICKQLSDRKSFLVRDRSLCLLPPLSTEILLLWSLCRPCACCPSLCEPYVHQPCCVVSSVSSVLSDSNHHPISSSSKLPERWGFRKTFHLGLSVLKPLFLHIVQLWNSEFILINYRRKLIW